MVYVAASLANGQNTLGQRDSRAENDFSSQLRELRDALSEIRAELEDTRRESKELRRDLDAARQELAVVRAAQLPQIATQGASEEQEVLSAKVNDLAQTRVSSGSGYRVRLSGLALFNAGTIRGTVDQIDLPLLAQPAGEQPERGSSAATVRQSQLTFEVFGPVWKGARTSGELSVDFLGGFPGTPEGVSAGLLRLRTGRVALDWKNDSLRMGQTELFLSPRSPTSLMTLAYPSFSYTGNLWTWTPQIALEHRWTLSESSRFTVTGGVLDSLTGEPPKGEYDRLPNAAEQSRIPAYAGRVGWERDIYDRSAGLGMGGYYSRQDWLQGRSVDAWAGTADWQIPLGRMAWISGEMYRGRAIGGLGGGSNPSVVTNFGSLLKPIDSAGGWLQLKVVPVSRLEFNAAFGEDHAFYSTKIAAGLFPDVPVIRNAAGMWNVIYRPRSSLALSLEYRHLRTVRSSGVATADHIGVAAGVSF